MYESRKLVCADVLGSLWLVWHLFRQARLGGRAGEAGMPVPFLVYVMVVVLLCCIGFCVPGSGRSEIQEIAKRRAVFEPNGDVE